MGSDGEKNFRRIFEQNLSNGTRAVTRNPILRSLVSQQKKGTVENFGEFKAVVYCLSHSQSATIDENQSATCNGCATVYPATSLSNISQRSGHSEHSRSRTTPSQRSNQLSPQASLLIGSTSVTAGHKVSASNAETTTNSGTTNTTSLTSAVVSMKDKDKSTASEGVNVATTDNSPNQEAKIGTAGHNTGGGGNLRSVVYMVDDCNHIYRLSFVTTNVNIVALAFNDSFLPTPDNEKCTQANSTDHYTMKYFRKHTRELNYVHYYELCYSDSKEARKEKLLMPKTTADVIKKENEHIASSQRRPTISSKIYVTFENFRLCFQPTTLIRIDRVSVHKPKKSNEETDCQVQNKQNLQPLQQDETCPQTGTTHYQIDTANLTIFQNNDIYGVFFGMSECVLERIVPFHQLATTTPLPDLVYCRISSLTSHKRFIYAPLPRTTYYYENPMRRIVYKNRHNRLYGLPPEWKSQMMQEKVKQDKKNRYNAMLTTANRMGSCRIYFAANNVHIRARSKAMKMLVDDGVDYYDAWSLQEKRRFIQPELRPNHLTGATACRVCNQILQAADAKSPIESVETKEDDSTLKN